MVAVAAQESPPSPGVHAWTNSPPRAFLKERHLRLYSAPGAAALGAMAGETRIRQVLADAGYTRVRRVAAEAAPFNIVLEARP